ncbi:hypothetical protein FA95DRAFT_1585382 [Auriscalpium vulgare]|uniref:Uncharacterized protein n=1 Tax=Auriscalpium vulgare TaxID=40419 RepID=A0ACB8R529_9AGAM|nr:hypothetical protein FA95DRAFT_1585382 [Auriscalpium vulgare]
MPSERSKKKKRQSAGWFEDSAASQTASTVLRASSDGRRLLSHSTHVVPTRHLLQPVTPAPTPRRSPSIQPDPDATFGGDYDIISAPNDLADAVEGGLLGVDDVGEVVHITPTDVALGRARRYQNSDFPLLTWIPLRDEYLDEVLRLEGRGACFGAVRCSGGCSGEEEATIRCRDCFGGGMACVGCAVKSHALHPLHRVEQWNGSFFARTSLASLGLRVQLNHPPGTKCGVREPARGEFTVIHTNGIHKINLDFCGCGRASGIERRQQLLRASWWPATTIEPSTAATFAALEKFHLLSLTGKLTGYDAYRALEYETDNSGLMDIPDRLPAWMTMVRQWRHIAMVKRAGRGHEDSGIAGTKDGACAVVCPACPYPGINLPDDWASAPPNRAWLYRLNLAVDANFRLKNRLRSSKTLDPGLNTGKAYFVGDAEYEDHLAKYIDQDEMSGCSRFAALAAANLKSTKGLRVTGVGGAFCARHDMWRPVGLGDLQKGERYCNMDYIFFSTIKGIKNSSLLVSYDIACQWSKNLRRRMADVAQWALPDFVRYAIPKFHHPAHREECQGKLSLPSEPGAGQNDGEAPERSWSNLNGAAASTKEMGPGARHDTLDDHCGHANWRKCVGMLSSLPRRLKNAILEATAQGDVFTDFSTALQEDHPEELGKWKEEIARWEATEEGASPYRRPASDVTVADVRLELAEEDSDAVISDDLTTSQPAAYAFILTGLRIQSMQLRLRLDRRPGDGDTSNQLAQMQESRTSLLRLIHRFRADQEIHMPRVASIIDYDESTLSHTTIRPENIRLHLPSDVSASERHALCDRSLVDIESKLRLAAASDALDGVRHQLRFRTYVNRFKITNVTGQRKNTRARALQTRIEAGVKREAEAYRMHRAAYLRLVGPGDWEKKLQVLDDSHLVGLGARLIDAIDQADQDSVLEFLRSRRGGEASGESRYKLPWIWYSEASGEEGDDEGLSKDLKIEWFKSRARSTRWLEEVMQVHEDMRRVEATYRWLSSTWNVRGSTRSNTSPHLSDGLLAYASKQSAMFQALADRCATQWAEVRADTVRFLEGRQDDGFRIGGPEDEAMNVD